MLSEIVQHPSTIRCPQWSHAISWLVRRVVARSKSPGAAGTLLVSPR